MAKTDIIIHDKKDNVGVIVIEKVSKGQDCGCWIGNDDDIYEYNRKHIHEWFRHS